MSPYNVNAAYGGKYIDGIPMLRWGQWQDCTYGGAMKLIVDALGIPASYDQIMGYSGACYRMAMADNWDPSAGMPQIGRDVETALHRALGIAPYCIQDDDERIQSAMFSIDHGIPVLCCGQRAEPEWCVTTGYADEGKRFFGRTYFDNAGADVSEIYTGNNYYLADKFPGEYPAVLCRFYDRRCTPVSPETALRSSLVACIELFEQAPNSYKFGYDAYDVLISGFELDDCEYAAFGNNGEHHLGMLLDARKAAGIYLQESTALLSGDNQIKLTRISNLFSNMVEIICAVVPYEQTSAAFGGQITLCWDKPRRMAIADALRRVVDMEVEIRLLVKEILLSWEFSDGD